MQVKDVCKQCTGKYCTKKISIFGILNEEQQKAVNKRIIHRKFEKGKIIFSAGDWADKFYLITHGKIKLSKYTKDGYEQLLYVLAEGDYLGDLSLLKKSHHTCNAEVIEDTTVCILTKDDFDDMLRNNPELALQVMEIFHDRIANLEYLLQTLGMKEIDAKLAGLLISFIKSFGTPTTSGIVLDIPLSREDMANHIGTSRETISRKLSIMQDDRIIEFDGYKKIIIKDLPKLEQMCS
ncbi:MAG: Crp/Fnr family transcriptional regulator [Bacillota bacterium]